MLAFSPELKRGPNIMQTISGEGLCVRTQNRDPELCAHREQLRYRIKRFGSHVRLFQSFGRFHSTTGMRREKSTSGNCWAVITPFYPPLAADTALYTHPAPTRWLQSSGYSLLCHLLENRWILASLDTSRWAAAGSPAHWAACTPGATCWASFQPPTTSKM